MDRVKNTWIVHVQSEKGGVKDETVKAFWAKDHALTENSVLTAGACQANRRDGLKYVGISCELVEADA